MSRKPIEFMLRRYAQSDPARFHMPGHMGRMETLPASLDVTELSDTESLFEGGPAVSEARALAAAACGAAESYLLVGGATAGIHAMIAYAGEAVTASRNAHRAVFAGGLLAGRDIRWAEPDWDAGQCLYRCETPRLLPAARSGRWVLATSPTYLGCVSELRALSSPRLLVDAAHGAHFSFGSRLPATPSGYAHLWVESAHKTLPSPTQTAWLHLSPGADSRRVARLLEALMTSSPSWLLLAGLDRARALAEESRDAWDTLADFCLELESEIDALDGLRACGAAWARELGYLGKDPTRLVADVRGTGCSGLEAAAFLREYGVQSEMADFYRVVFILTPYHTPADFDRLLAGLKALSRRGSGKRYAVDLKPPSAPEAVCAASEAFYGPSRSVELPRAAGRVAAAPAGAYPPGIPCWLPGERITADAVEWLLRTESLGGRLFGVRNQRTEVLS